MHKFTVGQSVDLVTTVLRPSAVGAYEIRHLLPAADGSPENPRYRIKNLTEKHERVASESELTVSRRSEAIFS
jgi:hypothetical protein